jgi:tripartite-type tricarboxylate transporter receptor subunit TctC
MATLASGAGTLRTGRVTAIAVASEKRIAALPEVPTLAELGIKDMVVIQWWGFVAPVNVAGAVQARLHKDLVAAIDHSSVRERVTELAVDVSTSSPGELKAFIAAELKRWAAVARDAGLKATVVGLRDRRYVPRVDFGGNSAPGVCRGRHRERARAMVRDRRSRDRRGRY